MLGDQKQTTQLTTLKSCLLSTSFEGKKREFYRRIEISIYEGFAQVDNFLITLQSLGTNLFIYYFFFPESLGTNNELL